MKSKSCGNCGYFTKFKTLEGSGGLCEFFDARTNTDCGHLCEYWTGIKYKRTAKHNRKDLTKEEN